MKKSQTSVVGRIMDFDQDYRNKNNNTDFLDILPYGVKPKNAWPWCEATFTEMRENKVYLLSVCADIPAMLDILCHQGGGSLVGCPYGWCRAEMIPGHAKRLRWVFDRQPAASKTPAQYQLYGLAARTRGEPVMGFKGESPLLALDVGAIKRCYPDFGHCAGAGWVFRFILRSFKGQRFVKILPFKPTTSALNTPAKRRKENERKAAYENDKKEKLRQKEIQKLWCIDPIHWPEMDQSWLDHCARVGHHTTALPLAGVGNKGTRMTMHELIKYGVNCYTHAQGTYSNQICLLAKEVNY